MLSLKTGLTAGCVLLWLLGGPMASAQVAPAPVPPSIEPITGVVADRCAAEVTQSSQGADVRAYDYGQVCRYRSANRALLATHAHIRLIFFGDSITEGWSAADPALFGPSVLNRGISGQTTSQMLVRFRQDVLDLHPARVQIMAGTNDIAGNTGPITLDDIVANIAPMITLAHQHHVAVIVASVLPADRFGWRPGLRPADQIRLLNARLRDLARRQKCRYIDYYALLANANGGIDPPLATDGVHPTPLGYARLHALAASITEGRSLPQTRREMR